MKTQVARNGKSAETGVPVPVGLVVHGMYVAGAEMLVAKTVDLLGEQIVPTVFCLDQLGPMGEDYLSRGVDIVCLNRSPGIDYGLPGRFARILRDRGIQIIHAHQYTPFFYSALAKMLVRPRPRIILTEHGRHFPDVVSGKRRLLNRLIFQKLADRVNACCQFSADAMVDIEGFDRKRVEVLTNGIDVSKYAPVEDRNAVAQRLGLPADRRYIAMIARFHPVKDHPTLIRAFAKVAAKYADVDLLLVGDGPDRAAMESLARELGIFDRIHFMGIRKNVPEILQAVDIFALTSISEAASLTLLEAMATAVPVVVTNVGGNPEIVRDGIDGLLATRGDVDAIADAFCQLLDNPERALTMGKAGRERVLEHYRLEDTIDGYWQLYRQLATHG